MTESPEQLDFEDDTDLSWFVVQTRVNQEEKANINLLQQGYEVYLPRYQKRRRHARRVDIVSRPLYPRYLFVGFDTNIKGSLSIRSTIGVSQLVKIGDKPAQIDASVLNAIREHETDAGFIELAPPPFKAGDQVEIVEGAFTNRLGLVEGITDNQRVTILMDMLGQKVRVALERTAVESANR